MRNNSPPSWEVFLKNVTPNVSRQTSSKRVEGSLIGKLPKAEKIPTRDETIRMCARFGWYPPGWRQILRLPDRFLHQLGGVGEKPDYSRCAPYIDSWKLSRASTADKLVLNDGEVA
jgi:hypothetical protein